jgi:hypothetical protein
MAEENFAVILSEFSPAFEGLEWLARYLRRVLFCPSGPLLNGSLLTGTNHEPEQVQELYDQMIDTFDMAVSSLHIGRL